MKRASVATSRPAGAPRDRRPRPAPAATETEALRERLSRMETQLQKRSKQLAVLASKLVVTGVIAPMMLEATSLT